jgi:UDP-2,3-diacylglucosamine hydrolase
MIIKDNALFLADVHFNRFRQDILPLLKQIKNKELEVSQLFLMGDIFDFLCGEVQYFQDINYELIDLLNNISIHTETVYFEGNHDYNLKEVFPKIEVFPRAVQPQYGLMGDKKIALAHGDIFTPKGYNIYSAIIRNSPLLTFLGLININNWLAKIIVDKLGQKKICNKMNNFDSFLQKRITNYHCDLAIEGHFHQGYLGERYINIPSFACDKKYMIYKDNQFKFIKV